MDDAGAHWRYLLPAAVPANRCVGSGRCRGAVGGKVPEIGGDSPDPALLRAGRVGLARAAERENAASARTSRSSVPKQASDAAQVEAKDALESMQQVIVARVDTGRPADLVPPPAPAPHRPLRRVRQRPRLDLSANVALAGYVAGLMTSFTDLVAFATSPTRRNASDLHRRRCTVAGRPEALALTVPATHGAIDFAATKGADLARRRRDGLDTFGSGRSISRRRPARLAAVLHAAQRADHARLYDIVRRGEARSSTLTRRDAKEAVAAPSTPELVSRSRGQTACLDSACACRRSRSEPR